MRWCMGVGMGVGTLDAASSVPHGSILRSRDVKSHAQLISEKPVEVTWSGPRSCSSASGAAVVSRQAFLLPLPDEQQTESVYCHTYPGRQTVVGERSHYMVMHHTLHQLSTMETRLKMKHGHGYHLSVCPWVCRSSSRDHRSADADSTQPQTHQESIT